MDINEDILFNYERYNLIEITKEEINQKKIIKKKNKKKKQKKKKLKIIIIINNMDLYIQNLL